MSIAVRNLLVREASVSTHFNKPITQCKGEKPEGEFQTRQAGGLSGLADCHHNEACWHNQHWARRGNPQNDRAALASTPLPAAWLQEAGGQTSWEQRLRVVQLCTSKASYFACPMTDTPKSYWMVKNGTILYLSSLEAWILNQKTLVISLIIEFCTF